MNSHFLKKPKCLVPRWQSWNWFGDSKSKNAHGTAKIAIFWHETTFLKRFCDRKKNTQESGQKRTTKTYPGQKGQTIITLRTKKQTILDKNQRIPDKKNPGHKKRKPTKYKDPKKTKSEIATKTQKQNTPHENTDHNPHNAVKTQK